MVRRWFRCVAGATGESSLLGLCIRSLALRCIPSDLASVLSDPTSTCSGTELAPSFIVIPAYI
eukprot:218321-Pyramimonas_sp.AAC.1